MEKIIEMLKSDDHEMQKLGMNLLHKIEKDYYKKMAIIHANHISCLYLGENGWIYNQNGDLTTVK